MLATTFPLEFFISFWSASGVEFFIVRSSYNILHVRCKYTELLYNDLTFFTRKVNFGRKCALSKQQRSKPNFYQVVHNHAVLISFRAVQNNQVECTGKTRDDRVNETDCFLNLKLPIMQ